MSFRIRHVANKPSPARRNGARLALAASLACTIAAQPAFADGPRQNYRPLVVGLGAVAGVVAFNVGALGVAALPGGMAYAAGATVPAEMSVAMSRVYATASAVAGGWIGWCGAGDEGGDGPVDRRLLAVGAGAVAGAAAFNLATMPLGIVPAAGGALAAVPYSVAMGSRLIAVTAAGAGALGGTWLYDRWSGEHSDYRYLLTLGAGALVGVAVGNYLTIGALGTPPYYAGAGLANAAGTLASPAAQAASRVYVIGAATLGAWAADWYWRR